MTWWSTGVLYQVYIRSFCDSDGDGVGDLEGIRARLPYIASLGVDAIWITPFYRSPMADHGYDVADYYDIDPTFGTLDDFDRMLEEAHRLGVRVIVDVVPNHTSSEHAWFKEAIADRNGEARERFIFRDPKPDGSPPNDWTSVFGGPAWTLDPASGQYYLHLFAPEQPDLNWRNDEVHDEFSRVLRFWLDRGVDGFRIDVAHGLYKHPDLLDQGELDDDGAQRVWAESRSDRLWNQPEVHDIYRSWRRLTESYPGDRLLCGEVFLFDPDVVSDYVRPDELHQAFNFSLLAMPFDAARWRDAIDQSLRAHGRVGAACTWVLSNHDVTRHVTRYGGGDVGRRRGAAATLAILALPGAVYLYQGEELGLEQVDVPEELRQDPVWFRSKGEMVGRDGCRTPMPWSAEPPGFGFTDAPAAWLPFAPDTRDRNVATLERDDASILWLYRRALELRRTTPALREGAFSWVDVDGSTLAFRRDGLLVVMNAGTRAVRVPVEQAKVLLASGDAVQATSSYVSVPPDTTVWVETEDMR